MSNKVTYRQQFTRCGKERCRKCREGEGHGPYWYAYWSEKGRTVSKYVGIQLPAHKEAMHRQADEKDQVHSITVQSAAGPFLRVYLLGQFRMERRNGNEWVPIDHRLWHRRRARALLGCLLTSPGRRLGREQVMESLWPDLEIDVAANRLNGAVHELRQMLEPEIVRPATSRLLRLERDVLELADGKYIWVDAEVFENLLKEANVTTHSETAERLLEEAASLYGGSYLLEELYSDWTVRRRDALQRSWVGLLLYLANLRAERGAFSSAIEALERLRSTEPMNETAVQRMMVLLTQLDRRGEALQVYHQHVALLCSDYESEPLPETRKLYEELRRTSPTLSLLSTPHTSSKQELSFSRPLFQLGRHDKSPLVGRSRELETMRQVVLSLEALNGEPAYVTHEKAMRGTKHRTLPATAPSSESKHPHFLLLLGEPGIGKTRLAEELSIEAYTRGWAVAWSRTYEQEGTIPYRSWIDVLRTLLQGLSPSTDSFPLKLPANQQNLVHPTYLDLERLSSLLPELATSVPQTAPLLAHEHERLHLWETTLGVLSTLARTCPLLIVLDDLHWTDESSIELLAYLVRHLQDQHVLLIGTCRDAELAPTHKLRTLITDLKREQAILTLPVQPLTQSQIGVLVAHLPKDLVQSIQTQAAGNPFFAEELARYADATANDEAALVSLTSENQKLAVQAHVSSTSRQEQVGRDFSHTARRHSLPEAIAALLDRRLSRLSGECQALLGKAAVLGGSFELSQLLPMATEHTEDALLDLLEEALLARLLTEEVTDAQITYHFWHPLIVSHLYECLSAARRTQLHRRAVEAIKAIHAPSQQEKMAATIAYHLSKGGGDTTSIAYYAELAGNSAYSIAAYSEAQQHYLQAIQALMAERAPTLDSTNVSIYLRHFIHHIHEKLFSICADTKRICRLLEFIAECSTVQGNFEDARHLYEAVLDLRASEAFRLSMYPAATDRENNYRQEAQIQALLWREIGNGWKATGEYSRAYVCYGRGKAVMVSAGVTIGAAWACLHLQYGVLLRIEGNYHEACRYLREALAILEQVSPSAAYHLVDTRTERDECRLVMPPSFSSNVVQPYKQLQTRTELALQGDPLDIGYVHEQLGVVAASVGRLSEALAHMHTALTIYEQRALVSEIARLCGNLGNTYIIKGEHASARVYLQRSLDLAERTGDLPNMAFVANNLGEVAHRSGDLVEAETWFQRSLAYAERINDREQISWCSVDLAAVQRDLGKLGEAATNIYRAITTGRAIKSPRCTRYALVALSDLRIIEAIILCKLLPKGKNYRHRFQQCRRLLRRATSTLQRATSLEGLEAEPMIGGKLLLATAYLLLNDLETAKQLTEQTMAEAQQHETTRAIGRAHRLLGRILTAQGLYKEAIAHYAQAVQIFQDRELRLDYARTLHGYGIALAQWSTSKDTYANSHWNADQETRDKACQQGLDYLQEAHAIFVDCQASVDSAWVECVMEQFM
jgi:DNA-binding SARP family transcriptional activator/tetratricopeptide (TPR) repeat protein